MILAGPCDLPYLLAQLPLLDDDKAPVLNVERGWRLHGEGQQFLLPGVGDPVRRIEVLDRAAGSNCFMNVHGDSL